ncbi:olfactory receptor 6C74-like [Tachyglossus aculeatus]|uniref:olfactory receptor 6C74-like n=1 Tax=Tachyglossus aculeatus TaxID=9261 RepID=UPI0018F7268A|nr:olfactory receptor 6C74-like [Tachyglossus aculeatus]
MVIILCISVTYILSITGTLTIVTLTRLNCRFHNPIFLATITTGDRTISYNYRANQLFFFFFLLGATKFVLLAAMSYDLYVAISRSLHYTAVISQNVCTLLVLCFWLTGFLVIFPPIILGLQLDFCGAVDIDHFFCDVAPMLLLPCSDVGFLEMMAFILALSTQLVTLVLVAMSYTAIALAILRLPSAQHKRKSFFTCSSHMVMVSITYGSCILMYIKLSAQDRMDLTNGVAVLNTAVALMLNLFIYTLRK